MDDRWACVHNYNWKFFEITKNTGWDIESRTRTRRLRTWTWEVRTWTCDARTWTWTRTWLQVWCQLMTSAIYEIESKQIATPLGTGSKADSYQESCLSYKRVVRRPSCRNRRRFLVRPYLLYSRMSPCENFQVRRTANSSISQPEKVTSHHKWNCFQQCVSSRVMRWY